MSSLPLLLLAFGAAAQENPTQRGDAAMNAGNYAEALTAYNEAIEREPQKSAHYVDRSTAHDMLGDIDKALADANKAIELDPKNSSAYDVRGWIKYTHRPNSEALADLTRALDLNPKSARVRNRRARILADENRLKEALTDVESALALALDYATADGFIFSRGNTAKLWSISPRPSGLILSNRAPSSHGAVFGRSGRNTNGRWRTPNS